MMLIWTDTTTPVPTPKQTKITIKKSPDHRIVESIKGIFLSFFNADLGLISDSTHG